jgi:hypothetical protein
MMTLVRADGQFLIAFFVAVAVFVVFICPLTLGPPAPHQKKSPLASLLAAAAALFALAFALPFLSRICWLATPFDRRPHCDRLALTCTRLC